MNGAFQYPELIGIIFAPGESPDAVPELRRLRGVLRYQRPGAGRSAFLRRVRGEGLGEFDPDQVPLWNPDDGRPVGGTFGATVGLGFAPREPLDPALLATLRSSPAVLAAGRIRAVDLDFMRVSRPVLAVRFESPGDRPLAERVLGPLIAPEAQELPELPTLRHRPDTFAVALPPELYDVDDIAIALSRRPGVRWAAPLDAALPRQHGQLLDALSWHHRRIGVPDAHQAFGIGRAEITAAVFDLGGIDSRARLDEHPEFQGRVHTLYDAVTGALDNDKARDADLNAHGIRVAGVLAAARNAATGTDEGYGAQGVAPGVALMGVRLPLGVEQQDAAYAWAAGLLETSSPPTRPADVICTSVGVGEPGPIAEHTAETLEWIGLRGRQGRGAVVVFSAGNRSAVTETYAPLCHSPYTIGVGAAELTESGRVMHQPESNKGAVDLVALGRNISGVMVPSATYLPAGPAPSLALTRFRARLVAAGGQYVLRGLTRGAPGADFAAGQPPLERLVEYAPLLIGRAVADVLEIRANEVRIERPSGVVAGDVEVIAPTRLLARVSASPAGSSGPGDTMTVEVKLPTGVSIEQLRDRAVIVGAMPHITQPLTPFSEARVVAAQGPSSSSSSALPTVTLSGMRHIPAGGEPIYLSARGSDLFFGDTSAAAPQVAGVAALMLSVAPTLTAIEVQHLLRETAEPMAAEQPSAVGAGLVRARAAVHAAQLAVGARDVFLRNAEGDTGEGAVRADGDSPDVWLRRTAPAGMAVGEHQDPVEGDPAWIRVRLHNRGGADSLRGVVRAYIARRAAIEQTWPDAWPWVAAASTASADTPWLIASAPFEGVPAGSSAVITLPWPRAERPLHAARAPADDLAVLVEVLPVDGPTGTTVHDNPHLAVRRITLRGAAPAPAPAPAPRVWIYDASPASASNRHLDRAAIALDRAIDPEGEARLVATGSPPVDLLVPAGGPVPPLPVASGPAPLSAALLARAAVEARGVWTVLGAGRDDPGLAHIRGAQPGDIGGLPSAAITLHGVCTAPGQALVELVSGAGRDRGNAGTLTTLPTTGRAAALGQAVLRLFADRRGLTLGSPTTGPFTVPAGSGPVVFASEGPLWFRVTAPDGTAHEPVHTPLCSFVRIDSPASGDWILTTLPHGAVSLIA